MNEGPTTRLSLLATAVGLLCGVTVAVGQSHAFSDELPTFVPSVLELGTINACVSDVDTTINVANPGLHALTITSIDGWGVVFPLTPLPLLLQAGDALPFQYRVRAIAVGPSVQRVIVHDAGSSRTAEFTVREEHLGAVFAHIDTIDFREVVT